MAVSQDDVIVLQSRHGMQRINLNKAENKFAGNTFACLILINYLSKIFRQMFTFE